MSTIKLISFSLLVFIFSLTSFSTTYASNPMVVNKVASSIEMVRWVQIDAPVSSSIQYLTNIPMTIAASADNSAGDLARLIIYVNGQPVVAATSPTATTTYTPTSPGTYSVMAMASYTDFSYIVDTMTFNVKTGGLHQVLVPIPVITP